ncbi:recombinase RecT [Salinarimonas sp. NSM]|uniref:recombinase RecT n=1 Tax=Salinarimonas sp. NSM TaxID=3458003 RepID=UPI0040372537
MNAVTTTERRPPAVEFRDQFTKMEGEIGMALPAHIPVERFMRVVLTAVNGNPDLLAADRRSLFSSAMKAAQDGLLPDGRDGALVIYNTKVKVKNPETGREENEWIKAVQWMPMIGGILKKVRNSGELKSIRAHVVHAKDRFEVVLGDEERIVHEPVVFGEQGPPIGAYAIAETSDGGVYREFMSREEIERVRSVSRAKDSGPWSQWWGEMARKTVLRRLAKRLPMSSDLDDLIRRDDELYDFEGQREARRPQASGLAARLSGARGPGFNHAQIERTVAGDETPALEHDDIQESPAPNQAPGAGAAGEAEGGGTTSRSPADTSPAAQAGDAAGRSGEGDDLPSPEDIKDWCRESSAFEIGYQHGTKGRPAAPDQEWNDDETADYRRGHGIGKRVRAAAARETEGAR